MKRKIRGKVGVGCQCIFASCLQHFRLIRSKVREKLPGNELLRQPRKCFVACSDDLDSVQKSSE